MNKLQPMEKDIWVRLYNTDVVVHRNTYVPVSMVVWFELENSIYSKLVKDIKTPLFFNKNKL